MSKLTANLLGAAFLVLAALYLIRPGIWGMHLSLTHTLVHLFSGLLALGFGLKGTERSARLACVLFGIAYAGLGVAGFLLGDWGIPSPTIPGPGNSRMWILLPNVLELGIRDHIVHTAIGVLVLAGMAVPATKTRVAGG